jgi:hypothetical protein
MFKQIKDIIELVKDLTDEILAYYDHLQNQTDREQIKQLINYLKKEKSKFKKILERYEEEEYQTELQSWIQFIPEKSIVREIENFHVRNDMSADEVIEIAVYLNNWLEDIFKHMIDKSGSKKTRDAFSALLAVLQQDKLHISANHALMKDV